MDVWIHDLPELWARPEEFVPTARMTVNQRVNAMVRFIIYVTLATYLWNRQSATIGIGVTCIALITLLHPRSTANPIVLLQSPNSANSAKSAKSANLANSAKSQQSQQQSQSKPCRRSTPENPFANFLPFDDPSAGPACDYDDHKDEIRANFNKTLFRDAEDIYEKQNSQRQFMTMPVTQNIPDTKAFAEFLAGPNAARPTCKESALQCRGFFP